ncbi:ribosomal protein L1 [Mytilinidion resinicola]|uniref:Ribosomal protein L1 n=1 Tax=Mytilinidion resinicola TaxID=574789 RepID=A0A6A6Y108_9PEZI|nr:ribosomal protein L1 [Mytilinidion resinicola]KAF2801704.1 ribosomal protein L1 [Mytilinidion resinicola]
MASANRCIAQLSRNLVAQPLRPTSQLPQIAFLSSQQLRCASVGKGAHSENAAKYKRKDQGSTQKKKKARSTFIQYDLRDAEQFNLCDAMQYIRAFEVGRLPTSSKYEMHVKLRSIKNGPAIRNRLRLPHPVKTDLRICVICPPDSAAAVQAKKAGAVLVGEDEVFDLIKEGKIEFERCICHIDSLQKLNKAALGRILGPRGLMPSTKMGTVVKDVETTVREMVGGSEYRERLGVIRMAIGQLGFSPEEMQKNIKAFMEQVKKDIAQMSDRISKDIHEVVLSSTNSPGFSLNGEFRGANSVPTKDMTAETF